MQQWSPKPLRPVYNLPAEDQEVTVQKGLSPICRQRAQDGSPVGPMAPGRTLSPSSPELYLKKGSLAAELPKATCVAKADPEETYDPAAIVKSFLNM